METTAVPRERRAGRSIEGLEDAGRVDVRGQRIMPRREFDDLAGDVERGPKVADGRSLGRILRDKH